jgi:hypothetical protein
MATEKEESKESTKGTYDLSRNNAGGQEAPMAKGTYDLYGRKYYYTHQEQINEYRSVSGVGRRGSEKYYKKNIESIRQKNLAHYHKRRAELSEFVSLANMASSCR